MSHSMASNSNCSYAVDSYHNNALELIQQTKKKILKPNATDKAYIAMAFKNFFKLGSSLYSDQVLKQVVYANIMQVAANADRTQYKCYNENKGLWCVAGQYAIVPPPKTKVHLCSAFEESLNDRQKVLTIIHEWFHLWGKNKIDYFPETYWNESADSKPEELVRMADQHMLFIHYVATMGAWSKYP